MYIYSDRSGCKRGVKSINPYVVCSILSFNLRWLCEYTGEERVIPQPSTDRSARYYSQGYETYMENTVVKR